MTRDKNGLTGNTTTSAPAQGLWAETAAEPALDLPTLGADESCDVLIIGAGFCGLSAAIHLASEKKNVIVVDEQTVGWGASGRNGGQVIAGLKIDIDESIEQFGKKSGRALIDFGNKTPDLVFNLIAKYQIRCEAQRTGWIQAAKLKRTERIIRDRVRQLQSLDQDVEFLEQKRMQELVGSDFYSTGMLDRRSGSVQPLAYSRGLGRAALTEGARIFRNARAIGFERSKTEWIVTLESGIKVTARNLLLAANGYIRNFVPIVSRSIIPVQSYQVATDPLPVEISASIIPSRCAVSDMPYLNAYFRRDQEGRFILGGRGGASETEIASLYDEQISNARTLFPALQGIAFTSRWRGTMALTRDHLPRLADLGPSFIAAYGCNGRGVALATNLGFLAAEHILGRPRNDLPQAIRKPAQFPFHKATVFAAGVAARIKPIRGLMLARS